MSQKSRRSRCRRHGLALTISDVSPLEALSCTGSVAKETQIALKLSPTFSSGCCFYRATSPDGRAYASACSTHFTSLANFEKKEHPCFLFSQDNHANSSLSLFQKKKKEKRKERKTLESSRTIQLSEMRRLSLTLSRGSSITKSENLNLLIGAKTLTIA